MPDRIRVALSIGSLYGGGSERQLVQILQHLDRDRFEPFLYLVYQNGELLPQVPDDVPITSFDTRTTEPKLYWPGRMHSRRVADMASFLAENKIDIAYDRTFHMTMIAGPATKRVNVARVSTVVTDPKRDFPQIAGRFKKLKWSLLRRAYLDADRVVAVSNGVSQATAEFYNLPRERVQTIYNSLDLQRIDTVHAIPEQLGEDRFHVVAVGRLHYQKGFDMLIAAAALLVHERGMSKLRVHILGDGPEEDSLRELIRTNKLSDHVMLHGYQSNAADWYRHAQLFCLSSRYEGMPNALMEAMACGVPVVSMDCPSGPSEILKDGAFGAIVPNQDVVALAAAIAGIHDHYQPMKARAERARKRIEEEFALPKSVRELEQLLAEIVTRRRRAEP